MPCPCLRVHAHAVLCARADGLDDLMMIMNSSNSSRIAARIRVITRAISLPALNETLYYLHLPTFWSDHLTTVPFLPRQSAMFYFHAVPLNGRTKTALETRVIMLASWRLGRLLGRELRSFVHLQ